MGNAFDEVGILFVGVDGTDAVGKGSFAQAIDSIVGEGGGTDVGFGDFDEVAVTIVAVLSSLSGAVGGGGGHFGNAQQLTRFFIPVGGDFLDNGSV